MRSLSVLLSVVALALLLAPSAARAQFDGYWSGPMVCDNPPSWANVPPLQHNLVLEILGVSVRLDGQASGGTMIAKRAQLRQDGSLSMRGTDRHNNGEWEFRLGGLVRGATLNGSGEYSRWQDGRSVTLNCRFSLTRAGAQPPPRPAPQPQPQPPQVQPKPQPQPQPQPPKDTTQANLPAPSAQEIDDIMRKACAGDRDAQFRAGELNEKGLGVRKNLVEAYRWYDLAQANGLAKGAAARDALESRMSRDEAGEARKPRKPGDPPCTQTASGPTAPPPQALYKAAESGNLAEVKRLLQANADPNATNADGRTPLMAAAAGGHAEVVKALLDGGADAPDQSRKGETALMLGAANGSLPTVQTLLDGKADPLLRDAANKDALDYAQQPPLREVLAEAIAKATEAKLNLTEEQKRKIQEALNGLGFDPKGTSGQFTADTRQAIKAWQVSANEKPTSYLTKPQADRLLGINAGAPGGSQEMAAKWLGTWVGNATFSYSGNVPGGNQTCRGEAVENIGITLYPGASPTELIASLFGSRSVKDTRSGGDGQALIDGRTSIMLPGMVEYATGTERRNAQGQPAGQPQSQRQIVKYEVQRADLLFAGKALRLTLKAQPVDPNQRSVPVGAGWVERQYFYLDEAGQRLVFLGPGLGLPDGTRESAAVQRQVEDNLDAIGRDRAVDNGKPTRACSLQPTAVTIFSRK